MGRWEQKEEIMKRVNSQNGPELKSIDHFGSQIIFRLFWFPNLKTLIKMVILLGFRFDKRKLPHGICGLISHLVIELCFIYSFDPQTIFLPILNPELKISNQNDPFITVPFWIMFSTMWHTTIPHCMSRIMVKLTHLSYFS